MSTVLTATAFLVLVAVAAYVIHRLDLQHSDRIAAYRYSAPRPGRLGHRAPAYPRAADRAGSGRAPWTGAAEHHPNRGVMTLPQLNIYRHDRDRRALVTLAGVIDPATAPQVRAALERCLQDGITLIDVDLTTVDRCDSSGLRVFLDVSRHAAKTHASLLLHHPSPQTERLLTETGSDRLLRATRPGGARPQRAGRRGGRHTERTAR
ncbi:STAS domain-containing protein [Streptomyces griseosporeus]|uniref:STAS domain-containing protein n=1 Tax=Streptomyces griseosporeus TaxID=1910 RepID=UPI0037011DE6